MFALHLLNVLSQKVFNENVGLCRENDVVVIPNAVARQTSQHKKKTYEKAGEIGERKQLKVARTDLNLNFVPKSGSNLYGNTERKTLYFCSLSSTSVQQSFNTYQLTIIKPTFNEDKLNEPMTLPEKNWQNHSTERCCLLMVICSSCYQA